MVFKWFKKQQSPTGRTYQFYANINPNTCETCLNRHGDLFNDIALAPPIHPQCRCGFLHVPADKFQEKQAQAERMSGIAQNEIRRRALFTEALEVLEQDEQRGVVCLEQAVSIDIHIEELVQLREKHGHILDRNTSLTDTLRALFVRAYFEKLDHPKYQAVSAGMYGSLEYVGRKQIQALFANSQAD